MRLLATTASVVALATAATGQVNKVSDFNAGPTKLGMFVHVPKNLKAPAPIVVAVHHCQGSAQAYSTETKYMPLSDQRGFILIYPNSKSGGGCFDVASQASMSLRSSRPLSHDGC
jgi:poly(3-hydroxybutyrate) depolymerase